MLQIINFGRVELRPAERVLRVDGAAVALGARAFDLLLALVERRDRVVSKNELLDLAWPGLVVEENNLSVQVSALRKVLGPAAIATVTGRGYRLALAGGAADAAPAPPAVAALPQRIVRRLAVVAHADVLGWQRLVARDAAAAVIAWRAARTELIEPTVPAFGGRLIELTPERVLLEFASVVDALDWALGLQRRLAERRAAEPHNALRMRIGLCVDDVIADDGKLVGDGVNLAAEVHQAAGHDDVLITQSVRDFAQHKLAARFEPLGERVLRQTGQPTLLYRVLPPAEPGPGGAGSAGQPAPLRHAQPQWERQPSLAVLPLLTEGPQADLYFGDGMTEEIIATLSLNRALLVIAHNSTLRYRDRSRAADLGEIAAELGVRYLLTGTVRRAGQRLRIGVELMHALSSRVIWQERYDGEDGDVFAFQARIAAAIAAAIDPQVEQAEIARVVASTRGQPTESFSAYDCVLRGMAGLYQFEDGGFDAAGLAFQRAIALDAGYAQAHAHLAWWYSLCIGEGRSSAIGDDAQAAYAHAMRAVQLDPRDAWALSVAGHLLSFLKKRFVPALELFDQALALNPSCAAAWARSATTLVYLGRADEALERVRNAMRLSPFDKHTFSFFTTCGNARLVAGRPDEAVAWLGKALRLNPRYNAARRLQVAALVLAGELAEARELAQEYLAADPTFSVAQFGAWYPLQPPHLARLLDALRRAGLPA